MTKCYKLCMSSCMLRALNLDEFAESTANTHFLVFRKTRRGWATLLAVALYQVNSCHEDVNSNTCRKSISSNPYFFAPVPTPAVAGAQLRPLDITRYGGTCFHSGQRVRYFEYLQKIRQGTLTTATGVRIPYALHKNNGLGDAPGPCCLLRSS